MNDTFSRVATLVCLLQFAFMSDAQVLFAQDAVDVFVLAGQSNMEGVGRAERLTAADQHEPDVFLLHSDAIGAAESANVWGPLRPAGWKGTRSGGFGVEMSLGAALSRAPDARPTYLIKHAVGGTSLFEDWHPNEGREFVTFASLVKRGLAELEGRGLRPVVRGMFWQQGEADARVEHTARAYRARLENFIVRTREMLAPWAPGADAAQVRFVVGQVIPDATPGTRAHASYPFRDDVRAAQVSVARSLKNVVTVPTDVTFATHASEQDGYRDDDNIHFDGAGILKLGEHMAASFLARDVAIDGELVNEWGEPASGSDVVRVASYNTYYVFAEGEQVTAATDWISACAPHLLALQELTNVTHDRLAELAAGWGHEHSALLKTSGFSVGLSSVFPIEVIERIVDGLHHGCLHARVEGIDVFVVHLSPFRWARRAQEAELLTAKIAPLVERGARVMVLGDFNAECDEDRLALAAQLERLERARASDAEHGHVENLRDGEIDFTVMRRFLDAGLTDVAWPFLVQARGARWTFPTGIWSDAKDAAPTGGTRIDHILTSANLAASAVSALVARRGVVNQTSDHYPVLVEFHGASSDGRR